MQIAQGQEPLVDVLDQRDINLMEGTPLVARLLLYNDDTRYTHHILYWYEKANFKSGLTVIQKYVRISLIIVKERSISHQLIENELLRVGREVSSYWEPLQSASFISLGILAQELLLITLILFIATTKIVEYINEDLWRNRNQKIFMNFATEREKILLNSLQKLGETEDRKDTESILEYLENEAGVETDQNNLNKTLERFSEYGFIERDIIFQDNTPKLVWRIF
jgi:hypothetical protein